MPLYTGDMSGALRATTALAAKGLPFEVAGSAGTGVPIARGMIRASRIGADPFDAPPLARRIGGAGVDGRSQTRWSLNGIRTACSLENLVPVSFLCVVALLLACRFRGRRREGGVSGLLSPPYGRHLPVDADRVDYVAQ
jgi:hypothetical protein